MVNLVLEIFPSQDIELCVIDEDEIELAFESEIIDVGKPYEGEYRVCPQPYEQELPTADKRMGQNIIVEAIPNNYGLIEWDGSHLRVS